MREKTNPEFELARRYVEETGQHVFLTGKAGTGKTTFLHRLKEASRKRLIVTAPTGVAAINAGGVTLHSFFQLPFAPYVPGSEHARGSASSPRMQQFSREKVQLVRSLDLLVIDEVSMVRADVLDHVDSVLRRYRRCDAPFGGVQLLLIGDMQQLAPVAKDEERRLLLDGGYYETLFFFGSRALQKTAYVTIELQTVYRQTDARFLELLNRIRQGRPDSSVLASLNERLRPGFGPDDEAGYVMLTTHNRQAQAVNERCLQRLPGKAVEFEAEVEGDFPEALYPAAPVLCLKEGAQVMFLKNDTENPRRFYNGKIGRVSRLAPGRIEVTCDDGSAPVEVEPMEWENAQYRLDPDTRAIEETVVGVFRHYPLRLAWAITIHKSQGLTFDRVIISAERSFAHGQVYVALSRCRSLQGLVLSAPLVAENLIDDPEIAAFTRRAQEAAPTAVSLAAARRDYCLALLDELFDFLPLQGALGRLGRMLDEYFYRTYPQLLARWKEALALMPGEMLDVARKFGLQYRRLLPEGGDDPAAAPRVQERISAAAAYFGAKVRDLRPLVLAAGGVVTDNKSVAKRWREALAEARLLLDAKERLLAYAAEGFAVQGYLRERALALLPDEEKPAKGARRKGAAPKAGAGEDLLHPEFFEQLRQWRAARAAEKGVPAYAILQQKALMGIANFLPEGQGGLMAIAGVGEKTAALYGEELLALVADYRRGHGL